jgi:hypothetical protein
MCSGAFLAKNSHHSNIHIPDSNSLDTGTDNFGHINGDNKGDINRRPRARLHVRGRLLDGHPAIMQRGTLRCQEHVVSREAQVGCWYQEGTS